MAPLLFLFGLLTLFQCLDAASILFFIHVNSYSHRVSVWPLAEELASRGHQVTFISAHQPKDPNPNITEIVPKSLEKHMYEISKAIFDVTVRVSKSQNNMINDMFDYAYDGCVVLYDSPEFKSWLASNPTVDLVIIDNCVCVECGVGLAYKLNARHMVFSAIPSMPHEYDSFGYTPESSAVPELEVGPPTRPMGFFTRVWNSLMSLRWWFTYNFYYLSKIDKMIRDKLDVGPEMPAIDKIASNVSLVLYTGDAIIEYPRAMPPNHINVAGLHLKEFKKPIPKVSRCSKIAHFNICSIGLISKLLIAIFQEIESFIGRGEDGFVYISFGSLVNSHRMPNHIKQRFFDVIKSFPRLRFLWKWNGEMEKEIPQNLMLGKWFPQNDLLAHEKIRAFVTQAGRPSSVEAIWNGVPMISFPILVSRTRTSSLNTSIKY